MMSALPPPAPSEFWRETDRADQRCRFLADRHYTRQSPGARQWARPGWTQVLYGTGPGRGGRATGAALWCWWRPKWESGLPGTERKDGLRCIECTFFRNETAWLSSALIQEAVRVVLTWAHSIDVAWPDGLITGIGSAETAHARARHHLPGHCFREAGWVEFPHAVGRADVWLRHAGPLPAPRFASLEPRGQRSLLGAE